MPHEKPAKDQLTRQPPRAAPVSIDARIAGIARRQRGVITRQQVLGEVEVGAGAIHRRLATGRLVAVHRGVYRVAGPPVPLGWAMAAALAGGEGAAVSGRSAAAVHAIGGRGPRVEITGPRERRHPGIHSRVARLPAEDLTIRLGVPVTTVARTVFDLAGRADYSGTRLVELLHRARIVRSGLLAELDLLIARESGPGRSGLAEMGLRAHLADDSGPIRSVFEREFRQALAESDLPAPRSTSPSEAWR
ncbi:MAG: type IV toxin-antitoxin system AbiEi family antitoxin domain-containing protein [Solirubrobacteraceae bacterium]